MENLKDRVSDAVNEEKEADEMIRAIVEAMIAIQEDNE